MKNKIVLLSLFFILIMSTTCFASVNYMPDDYADRLYNRLQLNYAYYVDNLNSTNIKNKFELFSGDDLQEFYNTNETIQNFINESVTVESFGEVFYAMSSDTVSLYIFYCNDDNNPIITPSYIYNQFQFNNIPCIQIRIDANGNLIVSSANVTSKNFTSNDVGEYFYHENYANQQAVRDDIIIENDTIKKAANYIPFIFNGEDLEFPYTKVQYNSEYYRLSEPLENGYINPPVFNNSNITGTIISSGDDYIIDATISGEVDYGVGNAELNSGDIDNLKNDVSGIINEIVPANTFIGMFNQIITGFSNALLGTGNETIEVKYKEETYIINSNEINLPVQEIKSFIGLFFNVGIVIAIALTISWIIRRMEEGDLITVLHMGDADLYTYEDLNLF